MSKKPVFLMLLMLMLCFGISVHADNLMPQVVINDAVLEDMSGFVMHSDTLYLTPQKASQLFKLSLSCDEYNVVYTFSTKTRSITYDINTGSVNISDRCSFAYKLLENAYPSYEYGSEIYVPIRMICASLNIDIEYLAQTHEVIIKSPGYTVGLFTSDGLAVGYMDGSYGIINSAGNVLLPFEYDNISNYDNPAFFKVMLGNRYGIAGIDGTLITEIIYDNIEYVSAGKIYLYIGNEKGMCNIDGRIIVPVKYDEIAYSGNHIAMVKEGSKWSLLNCTTGELSETQYDEVYEITDGIQTDNNMIKGYYALKNGKWGFIDSFGSTIIDFKYEALDKFDQLGRARIILNGKMGIIDCGGVVVIPPAYDYIYPFGTMKAAVAQIGSKYGAVNLDGSVAIPFEYDYIYSFNDERTTVAYKNRLFYILTADGKTVTDEAFSYIEEFKNGIALAYRDGYGYIDHSGNEIIECIHSDVKQGTALSVFLKKDDKWALFSPNGKNLTGYIYNDAGEFENGLSAVSVMTDGGIRYGFVNDSGDEIIPFVYSTAQKFQYGKAIVSQGSDYGIIDIEGKTVIPFAYTGFNPSYDHSVIAAADKNSKWGLVSYTNETLAPFEYDYIFKFSDGYAAVLKDHKYGVIDTNGNVVVKIEFSTAEKALAEIIN